MAFKSTSKIQSKPKAFLRSRSLGEGSGEGSGEGVVKFLILISIEVLIEKHSLQNSPE